MCLGGIDQRKQGDANLGVLRFFGLLILYPPPRKFLVVGNGNKNVKKMFEIQIKMFVFFFPDI